MNRNSKDHILWLDLETSGNQPDSEILEIGAIITDSNLTTLTRPAPHDNIWGLDPDQIEQSSFHALARPPTLNIFHLDPAVIEMHSTTGLWHDLFNSDPTDTYTNLNDLDAHLNAWLDSWGFGSEHIPLAGSGVMHFDRQYIKRDLPTFNKRLTYWAYDVGVIRRFLRDHLNIQLEHEGQPKPTHRALDDVRAAIAEYRLYRDHIRDWHLVSTTHNKATIAKYRLYRETLARTDR